MWSIPPNDNRDTEHANHAYSIPSTEGKIRFLHAAAGFPTKDTWLKAIKAGNYVTWPGINIKTVNRHFPESDETTKGHMKKQRQNVRSTKIKESPEQPLKKMHDVYVKTFNAEETIYTDQTGRFPANSVSGHKYIMVLVEIDSNHIDAEPMKSKTEDSMIQAYLTLWKRLTSSNIVKPKMHMLDNEASEKFKDEIKKNCKIQLVPPDTHRRNLAERAIQTFKNHFKAIIQGLDDTFPMKLWDKLLPQTILTLNLLRQSNAVPTVSAHQYIHGQFDYNAMPLAPLGCAVQMHEAPTKRATWAENTVDGWYLQTSPEHYRCHVIYTKKTRSTRISDTVWFKHRYITQPAVTPADIIVKAITDLTQTLKGRTNLEGIEQLETLQRLEQLLTNTTPSDTNVMKAITNAELRVVSPQNVTNATPEPRVHTPTVTFAKQTKPPNDIQPQPQSEATEPRVRKQPISHVSKARIDKTIPKENTLTRVTRARTQRRNIFDTRTYQRNNTERAQLVHDAETGEYLNYRQLLRDPKHKDRWEKSSANEFGRLAQGVGTRIPKENATNTINFILKNMVPKERIKDVTYGSFRCDYKSNKEEKY